MAVFQFAYKGGFELVKKHLEEEDLDVVVSFLHVLLLDWMPSCLQVEDPLV